ncbi:MAG: adenylate/guanylate cyclase domain-containing protein [Candidatus Rokuibacteriota bacterium]
MRWPAVGRRLLPLTALRRVDHGGSLRRLRRGHRNVAVMFVDLEGCTHLCEDLSLSEMNRLMEVYFSRYLDVVHAAGGGVTELLGDGLVALFEGPSLRTDSTRAILAALEIRQTTRELNRRHGGRHPPIVVNIGLNAGAELVGITVLRSQSGERWFYRAIGPVTNVAARICELAEHGQILVSGDIAASVAGAYGLRAVGPRRLKNVRGVVRVFEVLPSNGRQDPGRAAAPARLPRLARDRVERP